MNEAEKGVYVGVFEEDRALRCEPPDFWLKQWLWYYRNHRAFRREHEEVPQPFPWHRLLIAILVLVALTLMALLLLWNYDCVIIKKMCQDHGGSILPLFENGWESHITDMPSWMAEEGAAIPTLSAL